MLSRLEEPSPAAQGAPGGLERGFGQGVEGWDEEQWEEGGAGWDLGREFLPLRVVGHREGLKGEGWDAPSLAEPEARLEREEL